MRLTSLCMIGLLLAGLVAGCTLPTPRTGGDEGRTTGSVEVAGEEATPAGSGEGAEAGAVTNNVTPVATPVPPSGDAAPVTPLTSATWQWQRTVGANGVVEPTDPSRYTLTIAPDGTVSALLDCNQGGGTVTIDEGSLTFGPIASTEMACPDGSLAAEFAQALAGTVTYTADGQTLVLILGDGSTAYFAAAPPPAAALPAADMPLGGTWTWVDSANTDGTVTAPADPTRYTVTFGPDGQLTAQVDCNIGSSTYTVNGAALTLEPLGTTRMGCPEGSQADLFQNGIESVTAYSIEGDTLTLTTATGTMTLRR
jgi:heat shock protein HslJ